MSPDLRNKRFGNVGAKGIDLEAARKRIEQVPLTNRTTQRALATWAGLPRRTMVRHMPELGLRTSKRYLKPHLKDSGKMQRL